MNRFVKKGIAVAAALLTAISITGCGSSNSGSASSPAADGGKKLSIFATTGYLADAAKNIAPDANIITMVGPGGDPHTYQPSTGDIENIKKADVVFWNGLHMEAQMLDLLSGLGDKQLAVGDKLPKENLLDWPETDDKGNPLHDPHIWNSPANWKLVVGYMADFLAKRDPAHADAYKANATKYEGEIQTTADECKQILSVVPKESRVLITGHDAFNYFGQTFGLEVHATDFVSSEAQLSPEELNQLAKLIATHKVKVIFQDNLANPQAITSLKEAVHADGWNVQVSDKELFADSLGESAPTDTYLGVLKYNAQTIADALGTK